jgi:hypothetical protein
MSAMHKMIIKVILIFYFPLKHFIRADFEGVQGALNRRTFIFLLQK